MGKIFNKGLDKNDKKEGLFKRLQNIKDKKEEQLLVIKDQGEKQLKELKNIDKNKMLKAIDEISNNKKKNDEANKLLPEFRKIDETLDNVELVCTKTDGTKYDFNRFSLQLKLIEKVYNYKITLNEAIEDQTKLKILINKLNNYYSPKIPKKVKEKNNVLKSAKKLFDARDEIINLFEKGIFPYKGNVFKTKEKQESEESKEESEEKSEENKFFEYIENESKDINYDLLKKHFNFVVSTALAKKLYEAKDKKKNSEFAELTKVRWSNLKDEIKKMFEDEKN